MHYVIPQFDHAFVCAGRTDTGRQRAENQDVAVCCPELGFFAVSDGMGGLAGGKAAAETVGIAMPRLMELSATEFAGHGDTARAKNAFAESVRMMSDGLFEQGNTASRYTYGATLAGVWLVRDQAIFAWLGDSRGYVLRAGCDALFQATADQNLAALLIERGEMTPEEAKTNRASARLTAFVGMQPPAAPGAASETVRPGDAILLCSDGLYGAVGEQEIVRAMRAQGGPERVCERLIELANEAGGRDNIVAVYLEILPRNAAGEPAETPKAKETAAGGSGA